MNSVFIIGGFDIHKTALDEYDFLKTELTKHNYQVVPVPISWKRKTVTKYTNEFVDYFNTHKTSKNIVIGNSFGALVAFLAIKSVHPDIVFLCSLSPFFKEDEKRLPNSESIKYFGVSRLNDLRKISFLTEAKKLADSKTEVIITYGDKENKTSPPLVFRCKEAHELLAHSKLIEFKDTPHDMNDANYMRHILSQIIK